MDYTHIETPDSLKRTAKKMGIHHPIEALLCAPARYEDYRHVYERFDDIGIEAEHAPIVCKATVAAAPATGRALVHGFARRGAPAPAGGYKDPGKLELHYPFSRGAFRLEITLEDGYGARAIQTVFGAVQAWRDAQAGDTLFLYGTANRHYGAMLRIENAKTLRAQQIGTIAPVYLGVPGQVSGESVHKMIDWAIANETRAAMAFAYASEAIRTDCGNLSDADILAICTPHDSVIRPENLPALLVHLHAPQTSLKEGAAARLIASRICALAMQCRAQQTNARPSCARAPISIDTQALESLMDAVQDRRRQRLTENQKHIATEVAARLKLDRPMNGLLSGEVGAGKTLAYALPAVAAWRTGAQVAIMAPTTLLADQIARSIAADFDGLVEVERVKSGGKIHRPDAMLVGTMGLATVAQKHDYQPNFLILDEQHKLDTASRLRMVSLQTHTLEVSATPIPRSLALSLYSGMDVFTLSEQPVSRHIHTRLIDTHARQDATLAIRQALADGGRCAVVFARVQSQEPPQEPNGVEDGAADETTDSSQTQATLKSATDSAALFEQHFPGQVGLLHGQTPNKAAVLDAFRSGEKPLLVTTTIFETGIDVPDVKVLIVRDPQQMGLSQLHQLRGRLARTGGDGQCFLLTEDLESLSPETIARLSAFCQSTNGYDLACADMLARGAGDLRGMEQKGYAKLTFKGLKLTTQDVLMSEELSLRDPNFEADRAHVVCTAQANEDEMLISTPEFKHPVMSRGQRQRSLLT